MQIATEDDVKVSVVWPFKIFVWMSLYHSYLFWCGIVWGSRQSSLPWSDRVVDGRNSNRAHHKLHLQNLIITYTLWISHMYMYMSVPILQ